MEHASQPEAGPDHGASWSPQSGWTVTSDHVDWNALAAQVAANHEATGSWFF
jgi:hypothetical protein